jgi:hypothetical protein
VRRIEPTWSARKGGIVLCISDETPACDVVGLGRNQPEQWVDHDLRIQQLATGGSGGSALFGADKIRVRGPAGDQRIDGHTRAQQVLRPDERFGLDRRLANSIRRVCYPLHGGKRRRDVDNAAPSAGDHDRGCVTGHEVTAGDIRRDDISPGVRIGFVKFHRPCSGRLLNLHGSARRVVDENMQGAKAALGFINHMSALILARDVAAYCNSPVTAGLLIDLARGLLRNVGVYIGINHRTASANQGVGHCPAKTARRAGYDGDPSIEKN